SVPDQRPGRLRGVERLRLDPDRGRHGPRRGTGAPRRGGRHVDRSGDRTVRRHPDHGSRRDARAGPADEPDPVGAGRCAYPHMCGHGLVTASPSPVSMSAAEAEFVVERRLARVATSGLDGSLHVVPVLYAFAEGSFWFSSDPGALKARHLAANPRAALVVDEPPPAKAGVTISGEA